MGRGVVGQDGSRRINLRLHFCYASTQFKKVKTAFVFAQIIDYLCTNQLTIVIEKVALYRTTLRNEVVVNPFTQLID